MYDMSPPRCPTGRVRTAGRRCSTTNATGNATVHDVADIRSSASTYPNLRHCFRHRRRHYCPRVPVSRIDAQHPAYPRRCPRGCRADRSKVLNIKCPTPQPMSAATTRTLAKHDRRKRDVERSERVAGHAFATNTLSYARLA